MTSAPGIAPLRLAVVGGGWAGLAAAVHARRRGHEVTLFEMARQLGGRARSQADPGGSGEPGELDNGQHILIGAYRDTLALMRQVGVPADDALLRQPLQFIRPDGLGLALRPGPPAWAFTRAVLAARAWPLSARLRLLAWCTRQMLGGFSCSPDRSVAAVCAGLPTAVQRELIAPLCVAALNTPAAEASAAVFLRVLKDGLFGGPGSSDLLLPRRPLQALLPGPASAWLMAHGATLHLGRRVQALQADPKAGWQLDGQAFDAVVLACSAVEAARLLRPLAPAWASQADALRFEPIITVYLQHDGARLPQPMLVLAEDEQAPAQFVFDHGALGGPAGRHAFVISGAAPWVAAGLDTTAAAVQRQAEAQLGPALWPAGGARVLATIAERRATFRCTPALQRPPATAAPGLAVASDYVAGPYPATLEGAVRAGLAAVESIEGDRSFGRSRDGSRSHDAK